MMQNYNKYKFMSKNIIYVEESILKLKLLESVPLALYNIIINHDWWSLHSLAPGIQGELLRSRIQKGFSFKKLFSSPHKPGDKATKVLGVTEIKKN